MSLGPTRKTTNYLKCTYECIDSFIEIKCRDGGIKQGLDRDEKRVTHESMNRRSVGDQDQMKVKSRNLGGCCSGWVQHFVDEAYMAASFPP